MTFLLKFVNISILVPFTTQYALIVVRSMLIIFHKLVLNFVDFMLEVRFYFMWCDV